MAYFTHDSRHMQAHDAQLRRLIFWLRLFLHKMQLFVHDGNLYKARARQPTSDASRIAKIASHILIFNQACDALCRHSDWYFRHRCRKADGISRREILIKLYIIFFSSRLRLIGATAAKFEIHILKFLFRR